MQKTKIYKGIYCVTYPKEGIYTGPIAAVKEYDKILEDDIISIVGVKDLTPGKPLKMILKHIDGNTDEILLNHTFNENQIEWFKARSALNLIALQNN